MRYGARRRWREPVYDGISHGCWRGTAALYASLEPAMEPLPTTSIGDVKDGCWFVFPIDGSIIRYHLKGLRERILVDEAVVLDRKPELTLKSTILHPVNVAGRDFVITLKTISLMTMHFECSLSHDGVPLKAFSAKYRMNIDWQWDKLLVLVPLGLLCGLLAKVWELPLWTIAIPIFAASLLMRGRKKQKGTITIEEIPLGQPASAGAGGVPP